MGSQIGAMVDKLLTRVSNRLNPQGYVSEMALTPHKVKQQSGKLGSYGNNHLRIVTTNMGGQGKARRIESFTQSTSSYFIDDHGLSDVVTASDRRNFERWQSIFWRYHLEEYEMHESFRIELAD